MDLRSGRQTGKFMLWVDAVGGFRVCLGDEVTLGQPVRSGTVDVPILGDISSRHARIRRDEEGYLIEAFREVQLDGRPVDKLAALAEGSKITLGRGVQMVFRRPHALSATARLDFASHHRTQPSADAVLLMADSCILGPSPHCHVVCRDWTEEVILYRHFEPGRAELVEPGRAELDEPGRAELVEPGRAELDVQLYCRTAGLLTIDGVPCRGRGRVTSNSRVEGTGFSLNLEEISL